MVKGSGFFKNINNLSQKQDFQQLLVLFKLWRWHFTITRRSRLFLTESFVSVVYRDRLRSTGISQSPSHMRKTIIDPPLLPKVKSNHCFLEHLQSSVLGHCSKTYSFGSFHIRNRVHSNIQKIASILGTSDSCVWELHNHRIDWMHRFLHQRRHCDKGVGYCTDAGELSRSRVASPAEHLSLGKAQCRKVGTNKHLCGFFALPLPAPAPCPSCGSFSSVLSSAVPRVPLMILALRLRQGQFPTAWFNPVPTSGPWSPCAIMQLFACLWLPTQQCTCFCESRNCIYSKGNIEEFGSWPKSVCGFFSGQTMGTYKARPGRPDRGKLPSPHQTWCTALHCSGEGCCSKGLGLPGWSHCYSHPYS